MLGPMLAVVFQKGGRTEEVSLQLCWDAASVVCQCKLCGGLDRICYIQYGYDMVWWKNIWYGQRESAVQIVLVRSIVFCLFAGKKEVPGSIPGQICVICYFTPFFECLSSLNNAIQSYIGDTKHTKLVIWAKMTHKWPFLVKKEVQLL